MLVKSVPRLVFSKMLSVQYRAWQHWRVPDTLTALPSIRLEMANCVPLPIALAVSAEMVREKEVIEGEKYDVHSYTNRVHAAGRFREAATRHFPELSQPGTMPFRPTLGTDRMGPRRSEQLTMFRITTETCSGGGRAESGM